MSKTKFSEKELKSMCFDLEKVNYEELQGTSKTEKIQDLIVFLDHRNQLSMAFDWILAKRPDIDISNYRREKYIQNIQAHSVKNQRFLQIIEPWLSWVLSGTLLVLLLVGLFFFIRWASREPTSTVSIGDGNMIAGDNSSIGNIYHLSVILEQVESQTVEANLSEETLQTIKLASVFLENGNYEAAIPLLELIVEDVPTSALYNNLGVAYQNIKDIESARDSFDKALSLEQNNKIVLSNIEQLPTVQPDVIETVVNATEHISAVMEEPHIFPTSAPLISSSPSQSTSTQAPIKGTVIIATVTSTPCTQMLVAETDAYIRLGPSTNFDPPLDLLNTGQSAEIVGFDASLTWIAIKWLTAPNKQGWIWKELVAINECVDQNALPIIPSPSTPIPPATEVPIMMPIPSATEAPAMTPTPVITHQTCTEIRAKQPDAQDGSYQLYFQGNINLPYTIYCHNMSTTPSEYLSLINTGGVFNYSKFAVGAATYGSDMTTHFSKIRINPFTLKVTVNDFSFSNTIGEYEKYGNLNVPLLDETIYGRAWSCTRQADGSGNIDLHGTAFALAPDVESRLTGSWPKGTADFSTDRRFVSFTGGGYCGYNTISNLSLIYVGK